MFFEDEFDFFEKMNNDELSDFSPEMQRKLREKAWEQHPLYIKSVEIMHIVNAMTQCVSEEEKEFCVPVQVSAMALCAKFAAVHDCKDWLTAMQLCALMRYHSQYVAGSVSMFEFAESGNVDKRYVEVLRKKMHEYVKLFAAWMETVHALPHDLEMDNDLWNVYKRF